MQTARAVWHACSCYGGRGVAPQILLLTRRGKGWRLLLCRLAGALLHAHQSRAAVDLWALSGCLLQVMTVLKGRTIEIGTPLEGADTSASPIHIVCILNPLTRPAQRISQVGLTDCVQLLEKPFMSIM